MKQSTLFPLLGGLCMSLCGCQGANQERGPTESSPGAGKLSLRVEVGAVGLLARGAAVGPNRLVLRLWAPNAAEVVDTIRLSGGERILRDYGLAGGRTWTLAATGLDQNDSLIHQGVESFRIGPDSQTNVQVELAARYSVFAMRIPANSRTKHFYLGVDGAAWCDTLAAVPQGVVDTVKIRRDYLPAAPEGIEHRFVLKVSGDRLDKDTVLYALDTAVQVVSGENRSHRFSLHWVGAQPPVDGRAHLEVVLGSMGQVAFEVVYLDSRTMACGQWADRSGLAWEPGIGYGTLCDDRDGQVYRTVAIGSQKWMAQNLNYAGSRETGSFGTCSVYDSGCARYGRNYQAAEVSGARAPLCPRGWHVPSDAEMLELAALGANLSLPLKSREGWAPGPFTFTGGSDSLGFRVLPSGLEYSVPNGVTDPTRGLYVRNPGEVGAMWTSTGKILVVVAESLPGYEHVTLRAAKPNTGNTLRCLED